MVVSLLLAGLTLVLTVLLCLVARGLLSPRQFAVATSGVMASGVVGVCFAGLDHG